MVRGYPLRPSSCTSAVAEQPDWFVHEAPFEEVNVVLEDFSPDGGDAPALVREVVALEASPPGGGVPVGASYQNVMPGTLLNFEVHLQNDSVEPTNVPQRLRLRLNALDTSDAVLGRAIVDIVIPSRDGRGACDG